METLQQTANSSESTPFHIPAEMAEALARIERIGGVKLLGRVTELFRASACDRVIKLRAAVDASDLTQVSRLAHAVKGSAAQIGAEALCTRAARLERRALSLSIDDARIAVDDLERESNHAQELLQHVLQQKGGLEG